MQFSVTFRHMDPTDALKAYAQERLGKIKKYFPDPIACHVVMSTEKHSHRVDVSLQLHNGFQIAGREATENMYSSIDLVSAKIERQVRRYKDRLRTHKSRKHDALPVTHSVFSEAPEAPASLHEDSPPAPVVPIPVVRRSEIAAQSLAVEEAVMQLNLLDRQFLVFRSEDSGAVCVLYRREGGEYGLIDTGGAAPA